MKVEVGGHSVGSAMGWAGALWTPSQRILLWSVLEERQLVAKRGSNPLRGWLGPGLPFSDVSFL